MYPGEIEDTETIDVWRARFVRSDSTTPVTDQQIYHLLSCVGATYPWVHVEKLQTFDGKAAYTKAQGEE